MTIQKETMKHTILIGINHKTSSVEVREKLHFNDVAVALNKLQDCEHIQGCVILSTCNRVEIYATTYTIEKGFNSIIEFISFYYNLPQSSFIDSIYQQSCSSAVTHLFRVVSSLDSLVLGEMQIQGQIRTSYHIAREKGTTDSILNKLFQTAIQVGKRIRSETSIGEGAVSVGSVAVDLIKNIFSDQSSFKTLLIGAGKMAELTTKSLIRFPNCKVSISNRSFENAKDLASSYKIDLIAFENIHNAIRENDVIVVSTAAQEYIINKTMITQLQQKNNTDILH